MMNTKKLLALVLVLVMMTALSVTVFAADPSTPSITINASSTAAEGQTDTTAYVWYRILDAAIDEDPTQSGNVQSGGKVAYYVTTEDRATQLTNTGLFNVTRVGTTNKWYVELKDSSTAASAIASAFGASTFDLSKFPSGNFEQTVVAGSATTGTVDPGYYYITSTAGTAVVLQTLTAVTITEKNTYPPAGKTVDDDDRSIEIGQDAHYTLTVEVPSTANDVIVLTDTMSTGLTFKEVGTVKAGDTTLTSGTDYTVSAVDTTNNSFTITFPAATVITAQGKTITIPYTATVNENAIVETGIPNTLDLKYGNNYTSVPKTVNVETYKLSFDKVDGSDTTQKLTGAEFKLTKNTNNTHESTSDWIELVEVTAGVEYRLATANDTTKTTVIKTNGNTVTIKGLDADQTYYLVETKAPTGYNLLTDHVEVEATEKTDATTSTPYYVFEDLIIENNKGVVLPSTGGIGTTLFYVIGAVLVLGAGVVLVTKRRVRE